LALLTADASGTGADVKLSWLPPNDEAPATPAKDAAKAEA